MKNISNEEQIISHKKNLDSVIFNNTEYYPKIFKEFNFSKEDLLSGILAYNGLLKDNSNLFYTGYIAPAVLEYHSKVIGSYHRIREKVVMDFLELSAPKSVVEVGFGYLSDHILTLSLKKNKFNITLCDFSDTIIDFCKKGIFFSESQNSQNILFKKVDMNNFEYLGDYDTYIMLDSVEHCKNPTLYLKNQVTNSPINSKFLLSIPIGNLKGGSLEDFHFMEWLKVEDSRMWLNECGLEIQLETEVKTVKGIDHFAEFLPEKSLTCHIVLCKKI